MEENEFRNSIFAYLSSEGFVHTYKTQLRLALHKYASAKRDFAFQPYQHTLRSEIICNIIAEYLQKNMYFDTLAVFREESAFQTLNHEDVLMNTQLTECNSTILEAIINRRKRDLKTRSIGSQTETQSIVEKLDQIDLTIKSKRAYQRNADKQRMVRERLQRIREEKESQLNERIKHAVESKKILELSRVKVENEERYRSELHSMEIEYESLFLKKKKELQLIHAHDEESTLLMQKELERQIANVQNGSVPNKPITPEDIEEEKKKCNRMLNRMLHNAKKIIAERNSVQEQIQNEIESEKQTMQELVELRKKFVSIKI